MGLCRSQDLKKSAELRQRLHAEVGTRPIVLKHAAAAPNIEDFIAESKLRATASLVHLFGTKNDDARGSGQVFLPMVKLMLDPAHAGVVHLVEEYRILAYPEVTARVLEEVEALVYDISTRTYRFYSPAHRRAAERMAAEVGWFS